MEVVNFCLLIARRGFDWLEGNVVVIAAGCGPLDVLFFYGFQLLQYGRDGSVVEVGFDTLLF